MINLVLWDKFRSMAKEYRNAINIRNRYVICTFPTKPVKDITFVMSFKEIPGSFDVAWQIQNMLLVAKHICGAENVYLFMEDIDNHNRLTGQGHNFFFENVTKTLLRMFGICLAEKPIGHCIVGQISYNGSGPVTAYTRNGKLPYRWTVSEEATKWAQQYRGAVVFTLRQAAHYDVRNSMIVEWIRAAKTLKARGERVVFVPDTNAPDPNLWGFENAREAAFDVEKRAAIYGVAKANMFTANGPFVLCAVMPEIPYVQIQPVSSMEVFESMHTAFNAIYFDDGEYDNQWLAWHGYNRGEAGPNFQGPRQLWTWEDDTHHAIIRSYEYIMRQIREPAICIS